MSDLDRLRERVRFLEFKVRQMREQEKDKGGWWTRTTRDLETARERLTRMERAAYSPRGGAHGRAV